MAVAGKAAASTGASALQVRERGAQPPTQPAAVRPSNAVAERAGFEPAVLSHTAFRERHHQPLGHLSAGEDTKGSPGRPRSDRPGPTSATGRRTGRPGNNSDTAATSPATTASTAKPVETAAPVTAPPRIDPAS